jgi:hypothetical protein
MGTAARALALLALLGVAFLLGVAPFLGTEPQTGISRDLYAYFFPRFVGVGRAVAGGALPLWNPWELCGVPFLASGQSGALNPLVALVFAVLPAGRALAVHFVLHFLLCGALLYGLARALGLGGAGASVAAVVWTFSPALTHSLYHPNRIAGIVWLPAIFWLGLRASERGGLRWAAPLAVALALQTAGGYPELALDSALLLGLGLAAGLGAADGWDAHRVGRGLARLGVAGALGILVAALQILPTFELVRESAREITAARPKLSPGPAALPTLFGLRADLGLVNLGMLPALYVGATPLVLALVGAALGRRSVRLPFVAGAIACVLGVVAFDWLHTLPFYRSVRFPLPWAFILPFFAAMLAGTGLDALVARGGDASRRLALGLLATGVVLFLIFGNATSRVFGILALVPAALVVGRRVGIGLAAAVVVALVVGEVVAASPFRRGADPFPPLPHTRTTLELLRAVRAEAEPVRFLGPREAVRGVAMLERVDAVSGLEESAMPRRLRRIIAHFGMHVGLPEMPLRLEAFAGSKPLLDLLGVAYVTGPAGWAGALERAGLVALERPTEANDGLWRNPGALPRAFLVRRARPIADADAAFAAVSAPAFRPRDEAIVEAPLDAELGGEPILAGETARVVRRDAEEAVVAVRAASPALLVVTDTHYPGWSARLDGEAAEMRRVDFAFRGVVVPAGTHEVRFTYAPRSVAWGSALSAIGVALAAALWFLAPRARPG